MPHDKDDPFHGGTDPVANAIGADELVEPFDPDADRFRDRETGEFEATPTGLEDEEDPIGDTTVADLIDAPADDDESMIDLL